jgi:hypothetical protein
VIACWARHSPIDEDKTLDTFLLAFWIAARTSMSANNEIRGSSPINVIAGVAIDGPVDLAGFIGVDSDVCDKPVIVPFMGGTPVEVPNHYAQGDPASLLPFPARQFLIVSEVLTTRWCI